MSIVLLKFQKQVLNKNDSYNLGNFYQIWLITIH